METPFLFPALCINGVEITVPTTDKNCVVRESRRGVDHIAGFELPVQFPTIGINTIDKSVAASEINRAISYHRTGQKNVERIGDGLILRLHTVQSFRLEPSLAARGEFPFYLSGPGI